MRDQRTDKFQWGYTGASEPGVVYNPKDKTFYLYYAGMRYSKAEATIGNIGILLAQSKDGSRFTYYTYDNGRALILTRNVENAIKGAWFGYSTPSAIIASDGQFHLFTAFIVAPGGPATARHVVIAHAVSNDGAELCLPPTVLRFGEVADDVLIEVDLLGHGVFPFFFDILT